MSYASDVVLKEALCLGVFSGSNLVKCLEGSVAFSMLAHCLGPHTLFKCPHTFGRIKTRDTISV